MELARNDYYVMPLKDGVFEFNWLPATANMSDADFKEALVVYAEHAETHRPEGALVDVRQFQHAFEEDIGAWRRDTVVPRYNQAGIRRFAYVFPEGADLPPAIEGGEGNADGESFDTRYFDDRNAALAWLNETGT